MNLNTNDLNLDFHIEENPSDIDVSTVREGLKQYNLKFTQDDRYHPLVILIRHVDGTIAGGLLGEFYWGWLHISILWLDENIRGQGVGSRLMSMAEEEAIREGCLAVHLDTMSFQARPFYEKHGYQVFGLLDDLPPGQQRIFMWKKLTNEEKFD